jgi:hypothetical protein
VTEPSADPIAVLLARIEVKLDNSLAEQTRHTSTLDRHDKILGEHSNRITRVETRLGAEDDNRARSYSGRQVLWAAVGSIIAALSLFVVIILAIRSGG